AARLPHLRPVPLVPAPAARPLPPPRALPGRRAPGHPAPRRTPRHLHQRARSAGSGPLGPSALGLVINVQVVYHDYEPGLVTPSVPGYGTSETTRRRTRRTCRSRSTSGLSWDGI